MNLNKKNILITGAAVRVGRETALELSQTGAVIFCHYNNSQTEAESLAQQIQTLGGSIHLLQADLLSLPEAERLVDEVETNHGGIHVLINNAAVFYRTPVDEIDPENWQKQFDINLKAPFFMARKAGQYMKKRGFGKIINIGDTSGLNPWPGYIPYSLTKSGVIAMTKGLAKVFAPQVQVNCVNPGPVLFPSNYDEEQHQQAIEKTLLKTQGSPQDIARTIRFLLEATDYITGDVINVDGGRHIA